MQNKAVFSGPETGSLEVPNVNEPLDNLNVVAQQRAAYETNFAWAQFLRDIVKIFTVSFTMVSPLISFHLTYNLLLGKSKMKNLAHKHCVGSTSNKPNSRRILAKIEMSFFPFFEWRMVSLESWVMTTGETRIRIDYATKGFSGEQVSMVVAAREWVSRDFNFNIHTTKTTAK